MCGALPPLLKLSLQDEDHRPSLTPRGPFVASSRASTSPPVTVASPRAPTLGSGAWARVFFSPFPKGFPVHPQRDPRAELVKADLAFPCKK